MSTILDDAVSEETIAPPIVLNLRPVVDLTDEQLAEISSLNCDLRIECNAQGALIIMSPAFPPSSNRNGQIVMQLFVWANRDGTGIAFDSSAGFRLPNGAVLSPDAAWIPLSRWNALSEEDREKFSPICPDFVIELRSESDRLAKVKEKMQEYMDNGARLGLLIDPIRGMVHVYRPGREPEILDRPSVVSCEPELRGFQLEMEKIW